MTQSVITQKCIFSLCLEPKAEYPPSSADKNEKTGVDAAASVIFHIEKYHATCS